MGYLVNVVRITCYISLYCATPISCLFCHQDEWLNQWILTVLTTTKPPRKEERYEWQEIAQQLPIIIIKMNRSRSKKGRNSQIPVFISKLVEMLQNQQVAETICWTTSADSFNIKNITKFTEEVLPRYFKHKNFSSFIRQLNMYGFRKIRHIDGDNVYINENFKAGARQLLKNINRKIREEKEQVVAVYNGSTSRQEGNTSREINQLKIKQKGLEEMCKHFLAQNQRLLEENQNLVRKMESQSREKEKRLEEFLIFLLTQNNTKQLGPNEPSQMLSLTNQQYESNSPMVKVEDEGTPLEILSNAMQQSDHMKKVKALIEEIYLKQRGKRRENNYTIVNSRNEQDQNSSANPMNEEMNNELQQIHSQADDEKSFLSINDFLNAEDYDPDMNLEASN